LFALSKIFADTPALERLCRSTERLLEDIAQADAG